MGWWVITQCAVCASVNTNSSGPEQILKSNKNYISPFALELWGSLRIYKRNYYQLWGEVEEGVEEKEVEVEVEGVVEALPLMCK